MPNPVKAIKGGIQGIKNASMAVKMNNQLAKNPSSNLAIGKAPPTKKTLGPVNVAKAFVAGAKNPSAAKVSRDQLKAIKKK